MKKILTLALAVLSSILLSEGVDGKADFALQSLTTGAAPQTESYILQDEREQKNEFLNEKGNAFMPARCEVPSARVNCSGASSRNLSEGKRHSQNARPSICRYGRLVSTVRGGKEVIASLSGGCLWILLPSSFLKLHILRI